MNDLNLGDLDKMFSEQGATVGKGSGKKRPVISQERTSPLTEWIHDMDAKGTWPEFEKRVQKFADKFEVSFTKAALYILFNIW